MTRLIWILLLVLGSFSLEIYGQRFTCLHSNQQLRLGSTGENESGVSEIEGEDDEEEEEHEGEEEEEEEEGEEGEDDRKKRQAPFPDNTLSLAPSQTPLVVLGQLNPQQIGTNLTGQIINSMFGINAADDSIHDETEAMYETYDVIGKAYLEYDQTETNDATGQNVYNLTVAGILAGDVRCPNPSQRLYFRSVTIGHSISQSCDVAVACFKDITEYKEVLQCAGKYGQCHLQLKSENLSGCGRMSNYVKVEYDCVYDHSLLDICATSDIRRWKDVTITSPSYPLPPQGIANKVRTCECEISTDSTSALSLAYLNSNMAGVDGKCDEEMLLLEQKYSSGPNSKFKVSDELCGKRSDYIRRFGDSSIRLTYLLGGSGGLKLKGGFFAQVTAESISRGSSLINVKCKSVHNDGTSATNISQFPSRPTDQRTNRLPVIIKEQKHFIPPLRVGGPVTASPTVLTTMVNKPLQVTSPIRWRIGPRGRKYIPRPGHPNGPLFLDGGGARVIRRRYPGGRQPGRPIIRRRIIFRPTTPLTLDVATLGPLDNLNKITEAVTIKTPVTQDILNSSSPKVGTVNIAGAVKAGMDPTTKDKISIASSSEGTLIAVVASMASIIVIMISVGFYYFFRRYQRQDSSMGSDTSTSWYSYGDPSYMHTELSNNARAQPAKRGGNLNNSDESVYYESCDDAVNRQTEMVMAKSSNNEHRTQTNITNSQANSVPAMKTANIDSTTSVQNKSTDSRPVPQAPPRRKRLRPPPLPKQKNDYDNNITSIPHQSLGFNSKIKQNVYDNDKAVLQFQNIGDNANSIITSLPYPMSEHSSSTDHYDNNTILNLDAKLTEVEPIELERGHVCTEYASISEMQDMANSEC